MNGGMERLPKILRYMVFCGVIAAFQSDLVKGILQSDWLFETVFCVVAALLTAAAVRTAQIVKRGRAERKNGKNGGLQGKGGYGETFDD